MGSNSDSTQNRYNYFVSEVIRKINPPDKEEVDENGNLMKKVKPDTAFRAEMVRADNPQTEYQAYKHLVRLGVNIGNDDERRAFALVGAAIARHRIEKDGKQRFGQAMRIASSLENGDIEPAGERRMKRILACKSTSELIDVLRPILRFVLQNEKVNLDFEKFLDDILMFNSHYTKINFAKDFYKKNSDESENSDEKEET